MSNKSSNKTLIIFFIIGLLIGMFAFFLAFTLGDNTVEAMKSLIQADAALIGFFAVTTIFVMNSLQGLSKQAKDALRNEYEIHYPQISKLSKEELKNDKDGGRVLQLAEYCGRLAGLTSFTLYTLLVGVLLVVISILTALVGIGNMPSIKVLGIGISILTMCIGIVVVSYAISVFGEFQKDFTMFEARCLILTDVTIPKKKKTSA